jgi:hypothetical protein
VLTAGKPAFDGLLPEPDIAAKPNMGNLILPSCRVDPRPLDPKHLGHVVGCEQRRHARYGGAHSASL